ncbi:MAG: DUF2335 domain-containing protein [Nitrospinota bacterium]|nr:DUF2335 domain-containing protein [Nitrospinota bacterium]
MGKKRRGKKPGIPPKLPSPNQEIAKSEDISDKSDAWTRLSQQAVLHSHQHSISGQVHGFDSPFPHPEVVERYEKIHPGTFGTLLELTKNEQKNRHDRIREGLNSEISRDSRAQWMGYSLVLLFILLGFFGIYMGQALYAIALIIFAAAQLVASLYKHKPVLPSEIKKD